MRGFVFFAAALATLLPTAANAQEASAPDIEMWRLDCGDLDIQDLDMFSDGYLYEGQSKQLTVGCYLIRNGDRYLLWDAGLPDALIGNPMTVGDNTGSLERTIVDQLGELNLAAGDINFVGISHYHFDHTGQLARFAASTLLINERDFVAVETHLDENTTLPFTPWLNNRERATTFSGDHDVFGDGSVVILSMPGHTPGHSSLLVRLPETGNVLLTGDLYHFREQIENSGVPRFNTDRADTLASMERFMQIDEALDAMIVIQHDVGDIERLPAFPESAR